jgi:hypothetical protein
MDRGIVSPATSGRYTQQVTVSFVAGDKYEQNPWEQSGKFEGDIMLTDEDLKNGLINPAGRWPNKTDPFVTDDVSSEYSSTKL